MHWINMAREGDHAGKHAYWSALSKRFRLGQVRWSYKVSQHTYIYGRGIYLLLRRLDMNTRTLPLVDGALCLEPMSVVYVSKV